MSLKESLIQQTENAVDNLRKRRQTVELELEVINSEEREAREMLQFLKNGRPMSDNKTSGRKLLRWDDIFAILPEMSEEFTSREFADALGCSTNAAQLWLNKLIASEHLVKIKQGGSGVLSLYRKTEGKYE